MKENKINIFFFLAIAIVCILLTFAVSVWFNDCSFMKKDFLMAIISGISASSFVVLFSEIIKYKLNKKNIENALYGNLRELYCQLIKQIKCTEMLCINPKIDIAENVYSANVPAMTNFLNAIRFYEYEPVKSNQFVISLKNFQQSEIFFFEKYLSACMSFLKISLLETKIEKLRQGISNYSPTSSDEKVAEVLKIMKIEAERRCKIIDELIVNLDSICKNRFSWEKDKAYIDALTFTASGKDIHSFFDDEIENTSI